MSNAILNGPLEVKIFSLEAAVKNLNFKVENSLNQVLGEAQVKQFVLDEINIHSKLVNENLKSNLLTQKKEYENVLRKLGQNLQEAIVKIKSDLQYESKEMITQLEVKINNAIKIVTDDTNQFGQKWDTEL